MICTAHRRPAASSKASSVSPFVGTCNSIRDCAAARCSSLCSPINFRQAASNRSNRLAGHPLPSPTTSASMFRHCGFLRRPSTPFSWANVMNSPASFTPEWAFSICSTSWSVSGSRCSTITRESRDTLDRLASSLAPSQSASRQDRRKRGFPSLSNFRRITSNGLRTSPAPARTSSSPSMKSTFSRHSGCSDMSKVRKSRAVTRQACLPYAARSVAKDSLLPAPGSPSSTYADMSRNESRGRDARLTLGSAWPSRISVQERATIMLMDRPTTRRRVLLGIRSAGCRPRPPPRSVGD